MSEDRQLCLLCIVPDNIYLNLRLSHALWIKITLCFLSDSFIPNFLGQLHKERCNELKDSKKTRGIEWSSEIEGTWYICTWKTEVQNGRLREAILHSCCDWTKGCMMTEDSLCCSCTVNAVTSTTRSDILRRSLHALERQTYTFDQTASERKRLFMFPFCFAKYFLLLLIFK